MTKRTRSVLFLICFFLFLIVAPSVILYSQGYRVDFSKKKIVQTGGLFLKILPKQAEIYLDGKLKKKTDFLFGSLFADNLLPKKYKIEVKKDGYFPWQKTLEIKEREVVDAKNIVLVPEKPEFNVISSKVDDLFLSPDLKKIILKEVEEVISPPSQIWTLKIFDSEKNTQNNLISQAEIYKSGAKFLGLKFSSDSKKILLKTGIKESFKYFILEIAKTPPDLISLDFLEKDAEEISFNPKNSQKIFFIRKIKNKDGGVSNILFESDYNKKEISQPIFNNFLTYQFSENKIFWLSNEGELFKAVPSSSAQLTGQEKLSSQPFLLKKDLNSPAPEYEIYVESSKIFLKSGGDFYLFDEDSKTFKKIFENVKGFKISPDFRKLAYFSNNEIWVLFLEDKFDQPQKKAGEQLFLTRFSEKIGDVFWYTSHYLIFNVGNKIKVAEIDDRDQINIMDLAEMETSKIFWNQTDKNLYLLSDGILYGSEKLIR